jgi:hypothetical protein
LHEEGYAFLFHQLLHWQRKNIQRAAMHTGSEGALLDKNTVARVRHVIAVPRVFSRQANALFIASEASSGELI